MAAVLNVALLERGENGSQRGSRRVVFAAVTACFLASASIVGFSLGPMSGASISNTNNQTELDSTLCSACSISAQLSVSGCHGCSRPTKVASKITLSPNEGGHWLYMRTFAAMGQLMVSRWPSWTFENRQYFNLYELPGVKHGKKQYVLMSDKWPSYAAAIKDITFTAFTASKYGMFATSVDSSDTEGIMVEVCRNESNKGAVMIGSARDITYSYPQAPERIIKGVATLWAIVHWGSWFVYAWSDSPDNQGIPGIVKLGNLYWTVQDMNGSDFHIQGLDICPIQTLDDVVHSWPHLVSP